jgi:hypothetical protein
MKSLLLSLVISGLSLAKLQATLILYEPFDYSNLGGPVSSNTPANWSYGGSGQNDLRVMIGSLSYAGLQASTGNSVTNGGAGLGVRRLLGSTVSSDTLYFSGLFRIPFPGVRVVERRCYSGGRADSQ